LLSLPLLCGAAAAFLHVFISMARGVSNLSLTLAGTGVLLLSTSVILLLSGALAELIYHRGDLRDREFSKLTQSVRHLKTTAAGPLDFRQEY
jgi:hypothetical protein